MRCGILILARCLFFSSMRVAFSNDNNASGFFCFFFPTQGKIVGENTSHMPVRVNRLICEQRNGNGADVMSISHQLRLRKYAGYTRGVAQLEPQTDRPRRRLAPSVEKSLNICANNQVLSLRWPCLCTCVLCIFRTYIHLVQ